jgi:hypothetical protein
MTHEIIDALKNTLGATPVKEYKKIETGIEDTYGNKIFNEAGALFFQPAGEPTGRKIGWIDYKKKRFYTERQPDRQLTQTKCYGFCFVLLRDASTFDEVVIVEPTRMLAAKVADILALNEFLTFDSAGFLKQIFYPLEKFKITC